MDLPFAIKEEEGIDYFVVSNSQSEIETGMMCNKTLKDNHLSDIIKQEPNEHVLNEVVHNDFETYIYDSEGEQTKENPKLNESTQNKKRRARTTRTQYQMIISFMKCHPDFNKGKKKTCIESQRLDEDWDRLINELNAVGPPTRTNTEWRKAWADFKSNKKRKLAAGESTTLLKTLDAPPYYMGVEVNEPNEDQFRKRSRTDQHYNNMSPIYDEDGTNSSKPVANVEIHNTNDEFKHFQSEMLNKVDLVVQQQNRQNIQLEKMNKNLETLIDILKLKFANH